MSVQLTMNSKTSLATTTTHKVTCRYVSGSNKLLFTTRPRRDVQGSNRKTRLAPGMTIVRAVSAPESFTAWDTATQRVEKREDIKTIMLLGAGPIVIGQVCSRSCQMHVPLLGHLVGLVD